MNKFVKTFLPALSIFSAVFTFSSSDVKAATISSERANRELDSASAAATKHNYHKAFVQIHKLADQGHPTAQHLLAMMYENGVGVEKNLSQAVSFYEKSASQDFGDAQCALGKMYQQGNAVVVKDAEKARDWLTRAADRNIPEAEYKLGLMHANGEGIPQDMQKASQYLQKASLHGVNEAKDALAKLPPLPNYQANGGGNALGNAGQNLGQGLGSIQQAWGGYGDLVKTLQNANNAVQ